MYGMRVEKARGARRSVRRHEAHTPQSNSRAGRQTPNSPSPVACWTLPGARTVHALPLDRAAAPSPAARCTRVPQTSLRSQRRALFSLATLPDRADGHDIPQGRRRGRSEGQRRGGHPIQRGTNPIARHGPGRERAGKRGKAAQRDALRDIRRSRPGRDCDMRGGSRSCPDLYGRMLSPSGRLLPERHRGTPRGKDAALTAKGAGRCCAKNMDRREVRGESAVDLRREGRRFRQRSKR